MAAYAYKDAMRKDIIYAADAVKEDRIKKFYCPNPNCTAHLYICAVDGSKKAYFRAAKKEFPHVPMCSFGSSTYEFEADKFDETTFVFDNVMDNLYIVTAAQEVQKTPGNHNQGTVYLSAPINSGKYSFILQFTDEILYRTIRDEIYNNRDKIIIVAGKWEASGVYNSFVAEVISKKQIAIIK